MNVSKIKNKPQERFELPTYGSFGLNLQNRRSTAELQWLIIKKELEML